MVNAINLWITIFTKKIRVPLIINLSMSTHTRRCKVIMRCFATELVVEDMEDFLPAAAGPIPSPLPVYTEIQTLQQLMTQKRSFTQQLPYYGCRPCISRKLCNVLSGTLNPSIPYHT